MKRLLPFTKPIYELRHTWILLVIAIAMLLLGMVFLRQNFEGMQELKKAVVKADQSNASDLYDRLNELKRYVFKHMNTSTEVQLAGSYERAAEKAINESVVDDLPDNVNIFSDLPPECPRTRAGFAIISSPCAQEHVNRKLAEANIPNPRPPELPDKSPYIHRFAAPIFSFDKAGWSLLASAVAAALWLIIRIIKFIHHEIAIQFED